MAHRSPLINVMTQAAYKAGSKLRRDFGEVEQLQVSRKGPADFVSAADRKAEQTIYEHLARARPDFGFLMEEQGEIKAAGGDGTRWIVDPLDGTTNFLHGLPHFAINIAVEKDSDILAAVTYDVLRDELFWAEKGAGAYLNDQRLRVSGRRKLDECLLATGIPFKGRAGHETFHNTLKSFMPDVAGIRRFGSAALDLAYVAAGRFDGYWETHLAPWDIAAGILLVREAGGMATELDGRGRMLETGSILAGNPHIYEAMRLSIANALRG